MLVLFGACECLREFKRCPEILRGLACRKASLPVHLERTPYRKVTPLQINMEPNNSSPLEMLCCFSPFSCSMLICGMNPRFVR